MADFVDHVVKHEGLEEGQTPFRITSDAMGKWSTIHGFKIDHKRVKPKERKNFIYLENAADVKPAVRKQFENYQKTPKKYNLPDNPTVEDAVRVFDQTGADGKLKYLEKNGIKRGDPLEDALKQSMMIDEVMRQLA